MSVKTRINCIQVIINDDLTINYKMTLPVKEDYLHLFEDRKFIVSYIRNNKIRYMFVVESTNRIFILKKLTAAQILINEYKIDQLHVKHSNLISKLSTL